MKNSLATFLKNICVIICFLLVANNLNAADTRNTIAAGDWNTATTWDGATTIPAKSDNVTINHSVNLDANWGPENSGSIIFNAPSSGSGTLNMSGGTLIINANVTLTGTGVNLTGGTITVKSGYTLTIPGFNQANTNIIVEFGATLVVNGDYLNNHGVANVAGLITVNGNYSGQAGDADVVGTGNITSTGWMTGINTSSIFGTENPYCPSNCDGRNLFGGGNCGGTADAIPSATSLCSGVTVSFTSTLTGGYGSSFTKLYQWQIKNSSNVFVNISGATSSTFSASPSVSSTYRVIIGEKQNENDAYCYKTSAAVTISVTNCPNNWTGTTSSVWNLASNWSLGFVPTNTTTVVVPASVTSGRMPEISATFNIGSLENYGVITSTGSSTINVYGNIINNGTITAAPGANSTVNMVGTVAQTIGGTNPTTIQNLGINNSAGVSLLSALTINGTLSLTSGVLTTNNFLRINFDVGGNIGYSVSDAGTVNGNVSGARNLTARAHYMSVPFEGITTGQLDASTPLYRPATGSWLISTKNYDTQGWTKITDYTTTLSPISGYALTMFNTATITMSGTYAHGASYSSGNYTNVIPSTILNGMYFMVGNPYPSTLDWDNASGWTKTNIDGAIYYWNPANNSVASYISGTGTNGGTKYIPAMQAVLVKVPGGGGFSSVAVNNNARVLTNTSYYRTASNEIARLVVKNAAGTSADETVVRTDDLATEDFDSDADASKIKGGLALYTKTVGSTEEYSINTLPITGPELLVPLNLKVSVAGLYTIECSEYSVPGYSLILEDKQNASYTLLDNSTIYTLNANTTDNTDRFVLHFRAGLTTGVVSGNSSALQISTYDNQLMLNAGSVQTDKGTIRIYDASGLAVMELNDQSIVSGIQVIALPGLTQGLYIAKVEVDGTTYVGKVVLK